MAMFNYENAGVLVEYDYLVGVITNFDYVAKTATVKISGREYTCTFYYHCQHNSTENGISAFRLDDEVYVLAKRDDKHPLSNNYTNLQIIGHTDEIRRCRQVLIFQTYTESGNWFIGIYYRGTRIGRLNPSAFITGYDVQPDKPIFIVGADCGTNSLFFIVYRKVTLSGTDYFIPLSIQYPIIWFTSNLYSGMLWYYDIMLVNPTIPQFNPVSLNSGEPWNNGMMEGVYRVANTIGWNSGTDPHIYELSEASLYSWFKGYIRDAEFDIYGDMLWPCFHVQDRMWNDDDGDGIVDEVSRRPVPYRDFSTEWDPPDYHQRYGAIRGMGFCGNKMILGVLTCYDTDHTPTTDPNYPALCDPKQDQYITACYIGIFEGPPYYYNAPFLLEVEEPIYWQTPAFLDFKQSELVTFTTISEFERINQILGYPGYIFVSYKNPAQIDAYSEDGTLLASIYPDGNDLCPMSIVENETNGKPQLAYQCFNGPMIFCDMDTLETDQVITLSDFVTESGRQSSIAVNVPHASSFVSLLMAYRQAHGVSGVIFQDPMVCRIAQQHANWCVEHGRLSHVGLDGLDVHGRLDKIGVQFAAENLALALDYNPQSVIDAWDESPHHKDNMLYPTDRAVGLGVATYPASCHSIIIGPGQYVPETGGYTTEDTVLKIPPEYYGRVQAYVFNGYQN